MLGLVLCAVRCNTGVESYSGRANEQNRNRVPVPASAVLEYHDGTRCDGTLALSYVCLSALSHILLP